MAPFDDSAPRAYRAEEVTDMLLSYFKTMVNYWAELPNKSDHEKLSGLLFSTLVTFDGGSPELPAMDIVLIPHPSDKQYCIDNDEKWFEFGMCVNDCQLHEVWCKLEREDEEAAKKKAEENIWKERHDALIDAVRVVIEPLVDTKNDPNKKIDSDMARGIIYAWDKARGLR